MTTLSSKDHKPLSLTRRCLLTKLGALTLGDGACSVESRAPQEKGESASEVELSLALIDNFDRTRPLLDGSFKPKGIDLLPVAAGPAELFRRVAQDAEFEVTELSTSTFMILKSRGDSRYTGLPVFPSRNFRHG